MPLTGGEIRLEHSHDGRVAHLTLYHGRYTIITMEMRQHDGGAVRRDRRATSRSRSWSSGREGEHFTSGGDIAGFMEVEPVDLTDLGHNVTAPARSPKPVVVAIDGYCFGVGLELALSATSASPPTGPASHCRR